MFKIENHRNYYNVMSNGTYGIGIYPVLFGYRIRIWELGSPVCTCDLCFGANKNMISLGYTVLFDYLKEGGDPNEIPFQSAKPYPNKCEFQDWLDTYLATKFFGHNEYFTFTDEELSEYRTHEFNKISA